MSVVFVSRDEVLEPAAVVGLGPVARRLGERLLKCTDAQLGHWKGLTATGLLIVLGADLPWVDGVEYLGRDLEAPRLLLPTALRPSIGVELFERAIVRRAVELSPPLAVVWSSPTIVSVASALAIRRERLQRWLESAS